MIQSRTSPLDLGKLMLSLTYDARVTIKSRQSPTPQLGCRTNRVRHAAHATALDQLLVVWSGVLIERKAYPRDLGKLAFSLAYDARTTNKSRQSSTPQLGCQTNRLRHAAHATALDPAV